MRIAAREAPKTSAPIRSATPIISGAPPVRAPNRSWAVSPPAPWQTGIPAIPPASRLAPPRVMARRPGFTRSAFSPKYSRAASAVARQELAKVRGSCGMTSATSAEPKTAASKWGRGIADGPSLRSPPARTSATASPATTRKSAIRWRRRAKAAPRTTSARARSTTGSAVASEKLFGASHTSPQAIFRKRSPTVSCTPRISGLGKARPATSIRPVAPSSRKITPISREPAAISEAPSPIAIAIAPKALSGCTGIGSRKANATTT